MLDEHRANFNDEARMVRAGLALNDERSPNAQMIESAIGNFFIVNRGFVIPSSFVIRHSSFENHFSPPSSVEVRFAISSPSGRGLR
jgi:hypothetical protein